VFDISIDKESEDNRNRLEYLPYEVYKPLLDEFDIEYLVPLRIITNPDYEKLIYCTEINNFLIKDGQGTGEGIVIKNYDFYNKYGRQTWAKIVTSEFKEKHHKSMGAPEVNNRIIESEIVDEFVTSAFVDKEYSKIKNADGWSSKMIPRLLNTTYHEMICEEMWNILKKFKHPKIDFKTLNALTVKKIKEVKPEIFG